jgi:hypothetical protein
MKNLSLLFFLFFFNFSLIAQLPGNVIEFDGDGDFAGTNATVFNNLTSVTISMWVKGYAPGTMITNHVSGSSWEAVEVTSNWFIINNGNGSGSRQILNFGSIVDSVWHHLAAVWNGNEMIAYLDGAIYAGPDPATNPPWNSNAFITIGARGQQTSFFAGQLDEMRVWNKALSLNQIQASMNDTLSIEYYSTSDSGLIAYWRFDETEDLGIGDPGMDDVRDFSVSGIHADLVDDAFLTSSGVMGISNNISMIPVGYKLNQNYPNPFNPSTTINYQVPELSFVTIKVYDVLGSEVGALVNEEKSVGSYKVEFNASDLSSGIYFYRLQAGSFVETKKMVLIK